MNRRKSRRPRTGRTRTGMKAYMLRRLPTRARDGRRLMTASWIAYWYFSALTVLPWTRPLPVRRRLQITTIGLTVCAAILWTAWNVRTEIRYSAPLALILIGYYLSGLFFTRPTERFESWLLAWDRRLLGDPTTRFAHWPRPWLAFLNIIYMGCFLLVPAGGSRHALGGHVTPIDLDTTIVTCAELRALLPLAPGHAAPPLRDHRGPAL